MGAAFTLPPGPREACGVTRLDHTGQTLLFHSSRTITDSLPCLPSTPVRQTNPSPDGLGDPQLWDEYTHACWEPHKQERADQPEAVFVVVNVSTIIRYGKGEKKQPNSRPLEDRGRSNAAREGMSTIILTGNEEGCGSAGWEFQVKGSARGPAGSTLGAAPNPGWAHQSEPYVTLPGPSITSVTPSEVLLD